MRTRAIFAVLAGASAVVAQTTIATTTIDVPGFPPQAVQVVQAGHNASQTTYLIKCASATAAASCPFGSGASVVVGPHTFDVDFSSDGTSFSEECSYSGTTSAECQAVEKSPSTTVSMKYEINPTNIAFAIVSSAAALTPASASATATGNASVPTGVSNINSTMTTMATVTAYGSGSPIASSTKHASTFNAAVPLAAGNVHWAVGGAALALALAAF